MRIKQSVERVVPHLNIDATKVMTDAELEELQRQTDEWVKSHKLANELGRDGLKEVLRQAMLRVEAVLEKKPPSDPVESD